MNKVFIASGITAVFMLIASVIYMSHKYPTPKTFRTISENRNLLIAHAAGAINGKYYTNSVEALERTLNGKYSFIELDLSLTSDNHIVAVHDWEHFNRISSGKNEKSLSLAEFNSRMIYNDYTPLDADKINKYFVNNPNKYLVTDKLNDFTAMNQQLTVSKDKLLVEVFSYDLYRQALKNGIKYPMLCIWDEKSFLKHYKLLIFGKIKMITLPVALIPAIEGDLKKLYSKGVTILAFSSNDNEFIKLYINSVVTGYYVDDVTLQLD